MVRVATNFYTDSIANPDSGDKRTVPLGGGIGQIIKGGNTPVNLQASAYYNVEVPRYGADWQMRLQAQFLFPK